MRKTMDIKLVLCFLAALCATGYCDQPSPHCLARPDQGLCMGHMPRYYYEPNNNTCHEFIYGGCGGNHNNFMTENECERKCVTEGGVNPCLLRPEEGPCKAMIFSFYWDTETNKCGEFIYGGCQGNKNRFETVEECQDKCGENGSHPLSLPHVTVIVVSLLSVLLTSAL